MSEEIYLKRTIIQDKVQSAYLVERRNVRVYLPPNFKQTELYPVVYCQDGEDFFNFGRIATTTNRLIYDEGMKPIIIVGVDVDKGERSAQYSPTGDIFINYKRFFAEELLPYIERKYPVSQEASNRVIAGDSLGATVSLHLALDYPHLFQNVISLSGAYFLQSKRRIKVERDLSWLQMYMVVGLQEKKVITERGENNFLELNQEAYRLLHERGAQITYVEKDGNHTWGFWQQELPEALMWFYNRLS